MLQSLTTDPQLVGTVGLVGTAVGIVSLIVTIAGFGIAWVQLRRVKRSAEAAQDAVAQMTRVVRDREQSARLTLALAQLRIAGVHLPSNPGAAGAYVDTSCGALVDAKELAVSVDDQSRITTHLVKLRRVGEDLVLVREDVISPARLKTIRQDIQAAASEIEVIIARLHYGFNQIGALT